MITCIVFDTNRKELELIEDVLHTEAAYQTADEWKMEFLDNQEALETLLLAQMHLDIICLDITPDEVRKKLGKIRENYEQAKLLLISNGQISPMVYLRPSIHPDALLLRPTNREKAEQVLGELLQVYMKSVYGKGLKGSFTVETRSGKTILPYEKISYFEAREKKIFVRVGREEYGFYDTMDQLITQLPSEFIRCHRSYIINKEKIRKVMMSQNVIQMDNTEMIPISRTYRTDVKKL